MARNQPSLPSKGAFVVQLHAEASVERGQVYGRVEHITSYQATHFESLEELVGFMARVLVAQEQAEEESAAEEEAETPRIEVRRLP
jgi:hypothetical protein